MGANTFSTLSSGKTAQEAFREAVQRALYDYGHRGYTGTIAEKQEFVVIRDTAGDLSERLCKKGATPYYEETVEHARERGRKTAAELMERAKSDDKARVASAIADALIDIGDPRIDDKWGPAGCIEVDGPNADGQRRYLFFGWASS